MIQLENNYCDVEDVLSFCELDFSMTPIIQAGIISSINSSSRLIDSYCNTIFYPQDYSAIGLDLRFRNDYTVDGANLYLPFVVSSITSIEENGVLLDSENYYLPSESLARVYRLEDGELKEWNNSKIKIKAKFGFKNAESCLTNFKELPFVIKKQCAVFASYLSGLKVLEYSKNEKTKSASETGNRIQSLFQLRSAPDSWIEKTTGQAEVKPELYTASLMLNNYPTNTVETTSNALGYKVPIERLNSSIETDLISVKNVIPSREFLLLDSYKFLSI